MYKYKDKIKLVTTGFNIEQRQKDYVQSLENKSHWLRWIIDNDSGYQKYIKEEEGE